MNAVAIDFSEDRIGRVKRLYFDGEVSPEPAWYQRTDVIDAQGRIVFGFDPAITGALAHATAIRFDKGE